MRKSLNELKCREEDWDFSILSNRLLMKRTDRPDEWSMDDMARMALMLEQRAEKAEARLAQFKKLADDISDHFRMTSSLLDEEFEELSKHLKKENT